MIPHYPGQWLGPIGLLISLAITVFLICMIDAHIGYWG